MDDPGKLLEGNGKNLRHVKIKDAAQLRDANLKQLILQAKLLNRQTPLSLNMRPKAKKQRA
jgi:hypothetical protein